jgi:hypothetical protein
MLDQSKGEADSYHRFLVWLDRPLRYPAQKVLMPLLSFYNDAFAGDNESDLKTISAG